MTQKSQKSKDRFFGLKYIALTRVSLTKNKDELDAEALLSFAKWQLCKTRSILWNDPVWEHYTAEEVLIEWFSLKFDENEDLRKEFELSILSVSAEEVDWFAAQERKYRTVQKNDIIEKVSPDKPLIVEDFEDTFK